MLTGWFDTPGPRRSASTEPPGRRASRACNVPGQDTLTRAAIPAPNRSLTIDLPAYFTFSTPRNRAPLQRPEATTPGANPQHLRYSIRPSNA